MSTRPHQSPDPAQQSQPHRGRPEADGQSIIGAYRAGLFIDTPPYTSGVTSIVEGATDNPPRRNDQKMQNGTSRDIIDPGLRDVVVKEVWGRTQAMPLGELGGLPPVLSGHLAHALLHLLGREILDVGGDAPAMPVGIFELAAPVPVELVLDWP